MSRPPVGISAIAYALPDTRVSLDDLEQSGRLDTAAVHLREFGFEYVRVTSVAPDELAADAIGRLIAESGIDPSSVDAIFHAGALPASHTVGEQTSVLDGFNYPAAKLQYDLGLVNAAAIGIGQVGCTGLMTAVRLAADFLRANPHAARVICSSADVLPSGAKREFIYNVISDGACAILVERDAPRNRILAYRQLTKGYYWDATNRKNEIVAAYFPTAKNIVHETLADAGLTTDDIDLVIPHNVSVRSWEILVRLLGIPRDRLFAENIGDKGHVIAADNFINLKDAIDGGRVRPGQRLLLFNFGFGANWACMVIQH